MRRRQRLNVTVQKYAPNWYAILKSAHDLELAHGVGLAHDVSPTYMLIFSWYPSTTENLALTGLKFGTFCTLKADR